MSELPDLQLRDPNNKWLVRSALQKAVRRGRVDEALYAGGYLFNAGAAYFWKSLATIAIEDVGPCNGPAVAGVFQVYNAGSQHDDWQNREAIGVLIEKLCSGPKSRACCELSVGAEFGSPDLFYALCHSPTKLVGYAKDWENPVRAYAAWALILGVHKANRRPMGGLLLDLKSWVMNHEAFGEDQKLTILDVIHRPVDSMVAALPVVLNLMYAEGSSHQHVEPDALPPEEYVKNVSSAAMDMHTADGKRALMAFHTSLSKKYPIIEQIPKENAVKALGAVVFVLEGGLVDQRLRSPKLDELKELQDRELMKGYGVPTEIMGEVVQIVGQEFDRLNQKRRWVASL